MKSARVCQEEKLDDQDRVVKFVLPGKTIWGIEGVGRESAQTLKKAERKKSSNIVKSGVG